MRRGRVIVLVIFLSAVLIYSLTALDRAKAYDCGHDLSNFRCVKFLSNYDGDTLTVNIPRVHHFFGKKVPIRVYGIDSPERKSSNECEKEKAKEARILTKELLSNAVDIELKNAVRGKYFRVVAEVYFDGRSLADELVDRGLAVPYFGDEKPIVDWCQ